MMLELLSKWQLTVVLSTSGLIGIGCYLVKCLKDLIKVMGEQEKEHLI